MTTPTIAFDLLLDSEDRVLNGRRIESKERYRFRL
jgi:hypothetical protein